MGSGRRRFGRLELQHSAPELAHAASLCSTLLTSSDEELDSYRMDRLGGAPIERARLCRARDLLDAVAEALVAAAARQGDDAWARVERAWQALGPPPSPAARSAATAASVERGGAAMPEREAAARPAGPSRPPDPLGSTAPLGAMAPGFERPSEPPPAERRARDSLPPHARAMLEAMEQREVHAGPAGPDVTVPLGPSGTMDIAPAHVAPARPSAPPAPPSPTAPTAPGAQPPSSNTPGYPPAPAPTGSPNGKPGRSTVDRMVGATTQLDYGNVVDVAKLPFAEAVRVAGVMATDRQRESQTPPAAGPARASEPPAQLPAHLARLSVEQFATYCAHRAARPDETDAIDQRYGIEGAGERLALESHWQSRLSADPALLQAWREHLQRAERFVKKR